MKYTVRLVADAESDLLDIYRYVALNDSVEKADRLLDNLEQTVKKLETMPMRGHHPPELEHIGVLEYREIFFKPYRIIYQAVKSAVYVYCVLDGRRDLQDLLQQRLLR
ncbi:MAG: type II toxin-antitoxin system RelE/ParE family toxin [Candidatus Roizmanbacteria bacterium]|nr:type II toxin-antitoxin system RelE/ParE family toxin [Candidatus Roizmanbacteria bacterium]